MNLARILAQRTNVNEHDVRKLLDELPNVIIDAANQGEQVRIPRLGKFEVRRRRRYLGSKKPSKVTGKPFGLRMRLGLFFQSFGSFDRKLEKQLCWIENRQVPKVSDPDEMLYVLKRLRDTS